MYNVSRFQKSSFCPNPMTSILLFENLATKVPFHIPFSVAEIVIHMQGLHQTAALSQNKELVSMRKHHKIHSGIRVF